MPSTYSDLLGIENQATGENSATWGDIVDSNFELLEDAIAGGLVKSVAGSADVTLTDVNGATDEHRNMMHEYTGALTGNINVIVPDSSKLYFVFNNTSGAFTLTVTTAAGSGVAVPQGGRAILQADGTNVVLLALPLAGGAMTGAITTNSTFDGRDVAADGTKLDGIEALADVTSTNETSHADVVVDADIGSTVQAYDADTAKTDVIQNFTLPQRSADTVDNDGSFDLALLQNATCTPTAAVTLTFTNIPDGQSGTILLVNPSAYVISAAATTKVDASILATISTAGTYLIGYYSDSTNVYLTNSAVYV